MNSFTNLSVIVLTKYYSFSSLTINTNWKPIDYKIN